MLMGAVIYAGELFCAAMAPKSCKDAFLALKIDATEFAPKKRPHSNPTIGAALLFMTTSQRNLGDICSLTPNRLAVAFFDMDANTDILAPAKEAKEVFMIQHEHNPIERMLCLALMIAGFKPCFCMFIQHHQPTFKPAFSLHAGSQSQHHLTNWPRLT